MMKKKYKYKYKVLSLAVVSALYSHNLHAAIITLTDSNFPTSTVLADANHVFINTTTNGILSPHIDSSSAGEGLVASNTYQLTINSTDTFGIRSNFAGNYNSFKAIRISSDGAFISNSNIDISLNSGTGVYVANEGNALFNKKLDITSTGPSSMGIRAYSSATNPSNIPSNGRFKDQVTIVSHGDNSYGISSQVVSPDGVASLQFDKNVSITMNGLASYGIKVEDGGTGGLNSSTISFSDGLDLQIANGTGIVSEKQNHTIQINGISHLIASNNTILESASGLIQVNGQADIDGDIQAYTGGVVDLALSSNSNIIGKLNNYSDPGLGKAAGQIHLNFGGSGSQWTITDSSAINSLAGQGYLIFNNYTVGTSLSITDSNAAIGSHTVEVLDSGTNGSNDANGVTLISTQGGNAIFSMPTLANIGAYQYGLQKVGNNWQLTRPGSFSLTTNNAINGLRAGYLMNYNENQSLLQRMGELRSTKSGGDLWAKILAGKNKVDGNSQLSAFDQKFYGIQVGTDTRKMLNDNADFYLGLAFGYTRSDQDYARGDGNIDSYYVNAYSSYTNANGLYLDGVAKIGWQKQDFNLQDNQNNSVNGDTDSSLFGVSAELGYKYYFAGEQKSGWFTQPSAQIAYSHVDSDTFTASNGQKINFDNYSSVLGKAGVIIGYDFSQSSSNPFNVYLKTNYFHEFSGDLEGKINDETIKTDLGSNWWNYGIGFNAQVKHSHNIYFDIDQSRGADFKQLWKLNVGYRYQW
ncbi:autotransporter outer membrane beta-barrel domain-containing protein [Orbus sturtevantii]|uniref:autotransporter outer membrane beta-barrel domain-containing protein n=1 Tax=Orbus sturtevantii TaxID=3074109 RepID=UPI00370D8022